MDNFKGILLLLTILLAGTTFVFFLQSSTAKAQVGEALVLSSATRELLQTMGKRCSSTPEQFMKIAECIGPLLQAKDFKLETLKQPDDKRDETGYLVIKNINQRAYDAEKFTFYFNRELQQTGCNVPGEVGYEVTCRFDFPTECDDGSILETFYPGQDEAVRVFLKTC